MEGLWNHITNNQSVLSVINEITYGKSINDIVKNLDEHKICYITLNKPAIRLLNEFKRNKVNTNNILFIDGASGGKKVKEGNVVSVSSPYALTEISIALSKALSLYPFDIVLFDSLSTLNVYNVNKVETTTRFAAGIVNKAQIKNSKVMFTCLEGDLKSDLVRETSQFIDQVLTMKELYNDTEKTKSKIAIGYALGVMVLGVFSLNFIKGTNLTGFAITDTEAVVHHSMLEVPYAYFIILLVMVFSLAAMHMSTHIKKIKK